MGQAKMAHKLGMDILCKTRMGQYFSPVKNKKLVRALSGTGVAEQKRISREIWKDLSWPMRVCSQLWINPQINCDGRVLGCCVNYWGDYGNAFKEDLSGF